MARPGLGDRRKAMRLSRRTIAALLAVLAAAACGGSDGTYGGGPSTNPGDTGSTSSQVTVQDNSYSPKSTTVALGTEVTWTWSGKSPHTVTFDDDVTSATQSSGTFRRTFSQPGTYNYQCLIHGSTMTGTVTVK
jgi:plastocyanin